MRAGFLEAPEERQGFELVLGVQGRGGFVGGEEACLRARAIMQHWSWPPESWRALSRMAREAMGWLMAVAYLPWWRRASKLSMFAMPPAPKMRANDAGPPCLKGHEGRQKRAVAPPLATEDRGP